MVRYRRNFVPGGTFFFTLTLSDRRSSALVDNVDILRHAFRITCKERPFAIDAMVVLPEHLHMIMTLPDGDADFSGRWRRIKQIFTARLREQGIALEQRSTGEYALWQPRFWEHTIRNDQDFERHADYIHYNPIKHGLVERVRDWPYSSFHRYVRQGILPGDWAGTDAISGGKDFGER